MRWNKKQSIAVHTVGAVLNYNGKIIETWAKWITLAHDHSLPNLDIATSIKKMACLDYFYGVHLLLSEMMRSCWCFPHVSNISAHAYSWLSKEHRVLILNFMHNIFNLYNCHLCVENICTICTALKLNYRKCKFIAIQNIKENIY